MFSGSLKWPHGYGGMLARPDDCYGASEGMISWDPRRLRTPWIQNVGCCARLVEMNSYWACLAILLLLTGPALAQVQRGPTRQRPGNQTLGAPPLRGVTISERGRLKEITKKKIVIQSADNQIMTIRRNAKTRFLSGDREIKPFEIDLESMVAIEVTEDNDLKLIALIVRAEPSAKKAPLGSR